MSELAFNVNGESFEFPPEVTDLRARRVKMRGAPELVYGRDGRPVTVAVNDGIDELREAVSGVVGKYRLDALNADGKLVEGVPAAYVQIVPAVADAPAPIAIAAPTSETESVLREAMRTNAELARTVVSTFPAMMESAARLIEAADGAGISRRKPRLIEIDDDQEEEDEDNDVVAETAPVRVGGLDLNALVAQVVPVVVMGLMNGKLDLSKLGELLDWRKAAAAGAKKSASATAEPRTPAGAGSATGTPSAQKEEDGSLPPLDPTQMRHFLAIQAALTSEEAVLAREVAKDLSPRELRSWLAELSAKSVPDAVAAIRAHLAPKAASRAGEGVS